MMNGRDLRELLTSDIHIKRIFKGVYSRDKLPRYRMKKPSLLIVNTDHSKGPGEHWICIFVGINNVIEYWDSFRLDIYHRDIYEFVSLNSKRYTYNNIVLQPLSSETCGLFCFYYAYKRSRGFNLRMILRDFRELRPFYNDNIVMNHLRRYSSF